MAANMKLAFANEPFRHNLACVILEWLRLEGVITVRLTYISQKFPTGSKIIRLWFPKSCILANWLKQRSYYWTEYHILK